MIDRRGFLGSLSAAALAGAVPRPLHAWALGNAPQPAERARIAVLWEPSFPTSDATPLDRATLDSSLGGHEVTALRVAELGRLTPADFDVFLNPYGSSFPKQAWPRLLDFFDAGGNWVNVGGVPFAVPVVSDGTGWRREVRQTAYHKVLGITQAFPVGLSRPLSSVVSTEVASEPLVTGITADTAYALYYRLTSRREFPDEDGSDGPREAVVEPLYSVVGSGDHPLAAPVVRIDRLEGRFAGGRWVLANMNGSVSAAALRVMVNDAALGAHHLTVRPSHACYHAGERPELIVTLKSPGSRRSVRLPCRIEVFDDDDRRVTAASTFALSADGFTAVGRTRLETPPVLRPGLYRVEATVSSGGRAGDSDDRSGNRRAGSDAWTLHANTGFWVHDAELLAGGRPFSTDGHRLRRDGEPYIVTGTSYMASNVHRRFLLEPNPWTWQLDFAEMRRAGVNMIRTGVWTGWKRYMPEPGEFDEAVLRALDAFLLTARKHDIPVIFTFFAFLPESWGGENPYLDPEAVEAQKEFVTRIARRYRAMNDVIWDLINEPSFCSPGRLWLTRPNYDRHEQHAWRDWLRERYGAESDDELASKLAELWRTLPEEALDLPRPEEFNDRNIFDGVHPLKAMDYRLFANEMFARWARELAAALRAAGGSQQLVTVGQDEGGTYERPSPWFHAPAVDFTSNHTWWFNDDLLWDSIVTKTPGVPNLISETGVMFYEKINGSAWRTEEEARDLLERKLVIALATDTAGFIEWIWNTNPYMPSDNEAAIGLLRVDGSAKPELEVLRNVAAFAAESLRDLGPREPEPAMMVIPHSQMFSVRNHATAATRRAVRAMHYHCRVTMGAVGEYALDRLESDPKLLVVPCPRILSDAAWRQTLAMTERGATLLVTGPIDFDEHWRPVARLERFGVQTELRPVAQDEALQLEGATLRLSYRGEAMQRIETAALPDQPHAQVVTFPVGRGRLIWSPHPVELAESTEPTVALYRYALEQAGIAPIFALADDDPGLLVYPARYRDATLYAIVSERGSPTHVRVTDRKTGAVLERSLPSQRASFARLNHNVGRFLATYEGAARI